jgi:hypothetical protein
MIRRIHLLHLSHTDLGYTDLPSTCLDLHVDYIRQAMDAAEATLAQPEADRFRWTCEVFGPVVELLKRDATAGARLEALVRAGSVEVGALPWNLSTLLTAPEWEAARKIFADFRRRFACTTAVQNDINGLSWGIIPGLLDDGVTGLIMGSNGYAGGHPVPPPAVWRWEGPDGRTLPVLLTSAYCHGFDWFHEKAWRRGPVPATSDPYFHPPAEGDTWDATPAGLARAHAQLAKTLSGSLAAWPHETIAAQVTNHYRMDNDPPSPQLSRFVAAWNAAGLEPRIEMSTPSRFFKALATVDQKEIPVRRGDWVDWWADGIPAFPREGAVGQRSKRRLALLEKLGTEKKLPMAGLDPIWEQALRWTEHTFGSYDSVPRPWGSSTRGNECELMAEVYRLEEWSKRALKEAVTKAPDYRPSIHAKAIRVLGGAGWVFIPAAALPAGVTGLDSEDGKSFFPFEDILGAEWSDPVAGEKKPVSYPDNVWGFHVLKRRAWVPGPGRYRYSEKPVAAKASPAVGSDAHWKWRWDEKAHALASLQDSKTGREWLAAEGFHPFASLILEQAGGEAPYADVTARRAGPRTRSVPPVVDAQFVPGSYGLHVRWRREHAAWRDARQDLRLLPDGTVELFTRVWLRETFAPTGMWLALPFSSKDAVVSYDALGCETRVGPDQMEGSCGEHVNAGRGVIYRAGGMSLALDATDTPVWSLGDPSPRSGKRSPTSEAQALHPCLLGTWWSTNFPHGRSQLIETRHVMKLGAGTASLGELFGGGLIHYPCG